MGSEPDPPEPEKPAEQDDKGSEAKKSSSASASSSEGMTGSQASWNKSGSQQASAQSDLGKGPRSDLLVQQAVARARGTTLYQEATEKQKNTRRLPKEDDGGILGLAGNLMNQEVVRETRPVALGTSLWNCGTDRGPCG